MAEATIFTQNGDSYFPGSAVNQHDLLPLGTYIVNYSDKIGFYLTTVPNFTRPSKIYGDIEQMCQRFTYTANERSSSTGILLIGEKGSGKTLSAKLLSILALEQGSITLLISACYCGTQFNNFIQSIGQPCVLIFDEFEKVYDHKYQKELLTLFDGVFPTKKTFVLTSNTDSIDYYFLNRPGRIYYTAKFSSLDEETIKEYAQDHLMDQSKLGALLRIGKVINFNFDMLQAYIQEINRFNESPKDALKYMNFKISGEVSFSVTFLDKNNKPLTNGSPTILKEHPLQTLEDDCDGLEFRYIDPVHSGWQYLYVTTENLTLVDMERGYFEFDFPEREVKIIVEKSKPKSGAMDFYANPYFNSM